MHKAPINAGFGKGGCTQPQLSILVLHYMHSSTRLYSMCTFYKNNEFRAGMLITNSIKDWNII